MLPGPFSRFRHPLLRPLGLAWVLVLPAAAQRVAVTPSQRIFYASTSALGSPGERELFQFHARLEGVDRQPERWIWSIVDLRTDTILADAGSISLDGLYTPPVVSLSRYRLVRIKATPVGVSLPSGAVPAGTALAVIRPAMGLHKVLDHSGHLGPHWQGERVEELAPALRDGAPPESDPRGIAPGDPSYRMVHVPRLPRPDGGEPAEAWLVSAGDQVLRLAPDGKVDRYAQAEPGAEPPPRFTRMAARPWTGAGDGDWRMVLWDQRSDAFWRLDGTGRLARWDQAPSRRTGWGAPWDGFYQTVVEGLAMDREERVYASLRRIPVHGAQTIHQVVRIAPDGTLTQLAWALPGAGEPGAALEQPAGLALAPDGRSLALLDLDPGNPRLVRINLPDGAATAARLDLPPYRGRLCELGFHKDQLVLAGMDPPALFLVDPATGRGRRIFRDGRRSSELQGDPLPLVPGACFHSGRARERCGSLGSRFRGAFALDGQGRVGFVSGNQAGLVLLDWARPGGPGTASAAGAGESKGDTKAGAGRP